MGEDILRLAWRPAETYQAKRAPPVSYRLEAKELPGTFWGIKLLLLYITIVRQQFSSCIFYEIILEKQEEMLVLYIYSVSQNLLTYIHPFSIPRVMGAIISLGCNWWSNRHQISA